MRAVRKGKRIPLRRVLHELRINLESSHGRRRTGTCRNHELMIRCRNGRSAGRCIVNLSLNAVHLDIPTLEHIISLGVCADSKSAARCLTNQLIPSVGADADGARCRIAGDVAVCACLVVHARPGCRITGIFDIGKFNLRALVISTRL